MPVPPGVSEGAERLAHDNRNLDGDRPHERPPPAYARHLIMQEDGAGRQVVGKRPSCRATSLATGDWRLLGGRLDL